MARFDNIKVGDKVIISGQSFGKGVATVTKVNKTSFVCNCGSFNLTFKFDGIERGGDIWTRWVCLPWTKETEDEIIIENHRRKLLNKINKTSFNDLSTEKLEEIFKIICD